MISEFLEFFRRQSFCQHIGWHLVSWTIVHVDLSCLDPFLYEEETDIDMFAPSMMLWILADSDRCLVILADWCWSILFEPKFV